MPKAKFQWSKSRGQYVYASNGKAVPETRIRSWVQQTIDSSKQRIGTFSQQLVDGKINSAQWAIQMKEEIKAAHKAMFLAANGGQKLDAGALGRLGAVVRAQNQFLRAFSASIENGDIPLDKRLVARAKMYAQAARLSFINETRKQAAGRPMKEEKRVLSDSEHCTDCVNYAALGWRPLDSLPEIGDSQCKANCLCHFEYR